MKRPLCHVTDGSLPYLLSVPARPPPRPVLCFLHGYDEAAPVPIRDALTRHGPLASTSAALARNEFIIIAPQLPVAGDLWGRVSHAVQHIVLAVQAAHGGDRSRMYLTGFSFGGNGVFDLAAAEAAFWAALWAVDPTRVPRTDPGRPVWVSTGEVARAQKQVFIRALALAPSGKRPQGDRLYTDGGHDHVGSATAAYSDERIYAWLLTKRGPVV